MIEYIEREALVKEFERFGLGEHSLIERVFADGVYAVIENAPAADVAPVVHGRWEHDGGDFSDIWKCTACGEDWFFEYDPTDADTPVKYCPDCGARMDGE